jgi:hypothetical protein
VSLKPPDGPTTELTQFPSIGGSFGTVGVNVESSPYLANPSKSGSANYTALTNALIDAAVLGVPVIFPRRNVTYAINQVLLNPTGIPLIGDNVTLDGSAIAAAGAGSTQFAIKVEGTLSGSALAVTNAVTAGTKTISVPTATLVAGDIVLLSSSSELYMAGVTVGTEKKEELRRIDSITNSTTLELTEGPRFSYLTGATTTVQKINMVQRPIIEGINILMGGLNKVHNGIQFKYCLDATARNLDIDGCEDTGIQYVTCLGGTVEYCDIKNCTSPLVVTTTGYGVVATHSSRDISIGPKNRIRNCRHGVSGGSCAVSVRAFDNDLEGNGIASGSALDCHEPCFDWAFDDNRINGSLSTGIGVRGHNCKVRRNIIRDGGSHGILVKSFDGNPAGIQHPEIIGNDIEDTAGAGIRIEGVSVAGGDSCDCRITGGLVVDNRMKNNVGNNLFVEMTDGLEIGANIYDTPVGSGSDGNNIRLYAAGVSPANSTNIKINGGTFRGAPLRWLNAEFVDGLVVDNPNVIISPNHDYLQSCLNTKIRGVSGFDAVADDVAPEIQLGTINSNYTLTALVSAPVVRHTGAITADRTISLSKTQNFYTGARFQFVRTGAGAFNHIITNGVAGPTLKTLAVNTWGLFESDGTDWILIGSGAL